MRSWRQISIALPVDLRTKLGQGVVIGEAARHLVALGRLEVDPNQFAPPRTVGESPF